jgi:7-carboxy-7-deazaguanine synthase
MRVSEVYTSIQGEGPNTGSLTQFVRFGGCNLTCAGWPCDTPHAIDAANYRKEWISFTVEELHKTVAVHPRAVTLTGGEPFIQPKDELYEFVDGLMTDSYTIEVFTNGTKLFPMWVSNPEVSIIMDWKLPGSGENTYVQSRYDNLQLLTAKDAVKFVVASKEDIDIAMRIYASFEGLIEGAGPQFYLGCAWGAVKESELAHWMIEGQLGAQWKMNVQVHNYVWPRDERRR